MDAALVLKRRIELMLALPLSTLRGMSLQRAAAGEHGPRCAAGRARRHRP
jgi:hypothetical protein